MKNRESLLLIIVWLTFLSPISCTTEENGSNRLRSRDRTLSIENSELLVAFNSSRDSAFYEITNGGKAWRIPAPVYHPNRVGVDGLKMKDYAEQKVFISPDGSHIAIVENAGGENFANLLLTRERDYWVAKTVEPKVELFKEGKVLPFSMITGITNNHVKFGGYPVPFSELHVFEEEKVSPQKPQQAPR